MLDKKISVIKSSMPPIEEYIDEIKEIWETRWLTHTGPKHQKLQQGLCDYLGVNNIDMFANGHLSLEAAISVLGLTGEVITTPFTFASTTQAIVHCGLTPVFCDIDPKTYTIDVNKIESLINEKTSAIMPVHVYGNICDYKKIDEIAKKYNLKVIYDAAHAFGITVDGIPVGNLGDISMFSFHATKVFHTVEGGALTYSDSSLAREFASWRQFGMYGKEDAEKIGTNAKMTEFHAAMGICNLRHIEEEIAKRRRVAERYHKNLDGIDGIILNKEKEGVKCNYAYMPVVFDKSKFGLSRDEVCEKLESNGIFARKYFYPITSEFSVYKDKFEIQPTPIAYDISNKVLTLPLYADLSIEEVDYICSVILDK
ncbi:MULTISPECIES: DegT/DnrJ/EryC1/StrS aminotransferase family protein [Clostridium]|uniref:DegT/DnrJ/EryC1/StrS family aminotransferase n=1 Tax=Clostridium TaxID=1485 RepID=UPI001AA12AB5|nr:MULTISPECIES: DegT/DnrJ/EryC1/StrS family aminotransferase [Clostridium]MBO1686768.1 DegT/DnrJ/EryC1/StrS family aminotransferase [Clostridium butyricum]MDU0325053.1 DegT/DnrJ/EryC1/StrS family aminotransferase [Clostridium butyricum]MDU1231311.1 DegT/DnrJ/EryC1/StrS family aminotransferase [Clostridium sp.]MDU1339607.1 DegT/DnrJ/EryC1/StrS family aminotransferase [Clostridium butyricum]MDU3090949.1 DegT/DnrJ/EryC1/StrS family aminotransferase [Clostridium sp.]